MPLLVGREREQALLRGVLDALLAGEGRLILISGEAGIGKTALAADLCAAATDRGVLVLSGHCYDLTGTPPYGPWSELFRAYPRDAGLPALPPSLAQVGAPPEAASEAAFHAHVRGFLDAVSAERPLLLVLDDVHWADSASLDLLRVVARGLAKAPVGLLLTYRSDEVREETYFSRILPLLIRERDTTRLTLRPLDHDAVAALVRARYDMLASDDLVRLLAYLGAYAEGNPFFIGELLHGLEDDAHLLSVADGWTVGDLAHVSVPLILKEVVSRRIRRLGDAAPQLLAIAALIGQVAPIALWARIAQVDEGALLDLVERAVRARILDESADGFRVSFAHALIREVLYTGMLAARRSAWHRQIADALIAQPVADMDADAIAYHLRQAGDARAIDWLIRAGDRAEELFAHQTAAARFASALALLRPDERDTVLRCELLLRLARLLRTTETRRSIGYAEEAGQLAVRVGDDVLAAVARFRLGQLLSYAGERARGLAIQAESVAALEGLPERDMARVTRLDFVAASAAARHGSVALRLTEVGRFAEAAPHAERALASAPGAPNLVTQDAFLAKAAIARSLGKPEEAWEAVAAVYALNRATDDHDLAVWLIGNAVMWGALTFWTTDRERLRRIRAMLTERVPQAGEAFATLPISVMELPALYVEGAWAEAWHISAAAQRTRFARHPFTQFAPIIAALIATAQGDTALAWDLVRQELPDGPDTEPGANRFATSLAFQGIAATLALDADDIDMACHWLESRDRWMAWSGATRGQAEGDLLWARYHRAAGEIPLAAARATDALGHAATPQQPLVLVGAYRLLGELGGANAERHFDTSLALAASCAAPFERALTLLACAEARAAAGDPSGALALLDDVHATGVGLGARPILARADALGARLARRADHVGTRADGLTAREADVLRALAAGMSNREIAATFAISVRTAERHINNIYVKINARGRAEAAAYAFRHGLTHGVST